MAQFTKRWGSAALAIALLAGCTTEDVAAPTAVTTTASPRTTALAGPRVTGVEASSATVPNYGLLELEVGIDAVYENAFDAREISLDVMFEGPDGTVWPIAGFWDAEDAWRVRFTPSMSGTWSYSLSVTDHRGTSVPATGSFEVSEPESKGWLRVASDVDPSFSPRYLAYSDGTPWYGRGHADFDMALGGADSGGSGLRLFNDMPENGENFVMWWPSWGSNYIQGSYDDYALGPMEVIDFVLRDAESKGATLSYTIWTHQYLRTGAHPWGDDRWQLNGFSDLTDISGFFTEAESKAWQENYYRYIIARWAHSPAIAMWQTITEINGTEANEQTDSWHAWVNSYFQENDPYRHPTTATMSGSVDWPTGHAAMDIPQMHLYEFQEDPIEAAAQVADWTRLMWEREEKPNWIGEYGQRGQQFYPEMMHNSNWAALGAGGSITPIEWNDLASYGHFDEAMGADMARFATFVEEVPLATVAPQALTVETSDPAVRGWAVAGEDGGVAWAQDFALEGASIEQIRADTTVREDVALTLDPIAAGDWVVTPYDTWQGIWLDEITVSCPGGPCSIPLPAFSRDVAVKLSRS